MREVIREIFAGVYAPFTGRILASIAILPVLFSFSVGMNPTSLLTNIVDESVVNATSEEEILVEEVIEVKEPDAGNNQTAAPQVVATSPKKTSTPVDIAGAAPVSYDLAVSGKIATSVVNVGLTSKGAVAVPETSAGYYSTGGAHLLVGHNTGVFANLTSVQVGDVIEFWGANYRVNGSKVYKYDPSVGVYEIDGVTPNENGRMMLDSLYSGGSTGLNLMTCFGSYLPNYGTWDHRFVVFATRI